MNILLVDDEFLARNAVLMLLAQEQFPACAIREAVNGQEAIELIRQEAPDIALIDVSMPMMGGLALVGWIQENAPQVYCVMLSSYSDFEYVRDAMKLGAHDYLLKHQLTAAGLWEVLQQSGLLTGPAQTADDRERRLEAYLLDGQAHQALDWIQDSLFFVARIPMAGARHNAHIQSLQKTGRHILATEQVTVAALGSMLTFVFPRQPRETQAQHRRRVLAAQKVLRDAIERYHSLTLTLSEPIRCDTAAAFRNHCLYLQTAQDDQGMETPRTVPSALAMENTLTEAVLSNQQEVIARLIGSCFQDAAGQSKALGMLGNALAVLLRRYYETLLHMEAPAYPAGQAGVDIADYYIHAFCRLAERYQQISYAGFPELIRNTLVYLNRNSSREVSLSDVAAHLSINYSYLSYLFKKETGIGIVQYINAVRISHAMRLILLRSLSVSTAAEQAGFRQYGHFVSVFKGVTGVSPTAFRKHSGAFEYMMSFSPLKPEKIRPDDAG